MNGQWMRWLPAVLIAAVCVFPACDESDSPTSPSPAPSQVDIQMQSSSFAPANATVAMGGTVRWVNAQPIAHTITPNNAAQAGVWANQNVPAQQGFTFSHTFNTGGTYNYSCTIHQGMTGTITVQ